MKKLHYDYAKGAKKLRTKLAIAFTSVALLAGGSGLSMALLGTAHAASQTVYDATPATLPPNVVSLGYEATSTSQFGDYIHLGGTNRTLSTVTVTMSTWARHSEYPAMDASNWSHNITLNIYSNSVDGNGVPTNLLATKTSSVTIPWRAEGDPSCPNTGYGVGFAWRATDNQCYNGLAFNASFDMSSLNVTLPNDVIVGVAYNTADYGLAPIHQPGPYNSLNVGIPTGQTATIGTDDNADNAYWDTTYPGYSAGFRQDTGWSPNGTVSVKITATGPSPSTADQCKNNGWKNYGSTFKNQGDCVSFVATKGKNQPSGN